MNKQKTIVKEVGLKGVGLHTGKPVNVLFKPAPVDAGINFIRTDLANKPAIKACVDNLSVAGPSPRRTSLGRAGIQIQTIEHLMAALAGLGVDNLYIEIDAEEIPGLDGSSLKFLEILSSAGFVEQEKERRYLIVKDPVFVDENNASIAVFPCDEFKISYTLSYNHPLLKAQFLETIVSTDTFRKEFAPARTFCLEEEATLLQSEGFGRGANYDNTLVMGKTGVVKNQLRFPDEFVRHKMLDLLGDLYILGVPLKGHVVALKSGHALNLKLVEKISGQNNSSPALTAIPNYQIPDAGGLDIQAIMRVLPHREPFLFVDRIISLEKGKSVRGIKNVTINDYFFKGHFPGRPVMPGVIIIEAMAQVGGVMMMASEENQGKIAYFMAADNVKFRKTVVPGDQLILEAQAIKVKSRTGQVHTRALVEDKVVAEADLMFVLVD